MSVFENCESGTMCRGVDAQQSRSASGFAGQKPQKSLSSCEFKAWYNGHFGFWVHILENESREP